MCGRTIHSCPSWCCPWHDETIYAERMLSAGANGYIMKQAASEQFLASLRRVLDGGIYVSEAVGNNMIQKFAAGWGVHFRQPDRPA